MAEFVSTVSKFSCERKIICVPKKKTKHFQEGTIVKVKKIRGVKK